MGPSSNFTANAGSCLGWAPISDTFFKVIPNIRNAKFKLQLKGMVAWELGACLIHGLGLHWDWLYLYCNVMWSPFR
jgi:hypothetical protein